CGGRRPGGRGAAGGRDESRPQDSESADASLRRAARAARVGRAAAPAVQGEHRDRVVRAVRDEAAVHAGAGAGGREEDVAADVGSVAQPGEKWPDLTIT